MGQTIQNLSKRSLKSKPIFTNRFVIEVCEKIHTHFRNLRLNLELDDFIKLAEGFRDSLERWDKRGRPEPGKKHIELTRKNIPFQDSNNEILVNLNRNLYNKNKGIYSEGAEFNEKNYIHLKLRDIRLELSISDFLILADAVKEADRKIKNSDLSALLQKA